MNIPIRGKINLSFASSAIAVVQVVSSLLTAFNYFLLASSLGPSDIGKLSVILTTSVVLSMFLSLGYHKAAIYYVGRGELLVETVIANGAVITGLLFVILFFMLGVSKKYVPVLFPGVDYPIFFIAIICTPVRLFITYMSEASLAANRLRITLLATGLPATIYSAGCILLVCFDKSSVNNVIALFVVATIASSIIALISMVIASERRWAFWPDWISFVVCIRFGGKVLVGEISQYATYRTDVLLVGHWASATDSGYYSIAVRLAEIVWYISNSVQLALSARSAQEENSANREDLMCRAVKIATVVSILVAVAVCAGSVLLLPMILPAYRASIPLVLILVPGTTAFGVFQIIVGSLMGSGRPDVVAKMRVVLMFISLALYFGLIPSFGHLGAALGTTSAYALSAIVAIIVSSKTYKLPIGAYVSWGKGETAIITTMAGKARNLLRSFTQV